VDWTVVISGGGDTGVEAGVVTAVMGAVVEGAAGGAVGTGVVSGALPPVHPAAMMARTRHPARTRVKREDFFKGSVTAQELGGRRI
jgi:hypothetical protein